MNCGQPAEWLVTIPYSVGKIGRVLVYCDECRNRPTPIAVSIPLEFVDEDMFVELYRRGYTESAPAFAAQIVFGEERPEVAARAKEYLKHD
jgi:hypothetical protein